MQITLQHHCEILFFFFLRKSKSSQGAQTGGTQVPLSETVQPNCTNQSFSQQCILLFLLFLFGCFCWVFFCLACPSSAGILPTHMSVKQPYWVSHVRIQNWSLDGLLQKQVWEKCLLVLVSPSSGAWLCSR